jgi:diguanylate cyclase (GGDEF)-like protein
MPGVSGDERWHHLSFLLSPESGAPTLSVITRGLLRIVALLAALGIGVADYALGQGITFLPLYLLVILPLSFFESFLAGVAAAWVVSMIVLGVDIIGRGPVPGYLLYLRTGLHFAMFIVAAATASWIARIYTGLKELSIRDGLTGLYNHTYFKTRLGEEVIRAARFDRPLSIILIDLDHFKSCNDTYGHTVGDDVLRGLAGLMKTNLRAVDIPARYGGEEFVILLPETGLGLAKEVAERLRWIVERHRFMLDHPKGPLAVTLSGGVAAFDRARSTPDLLLDAADRALYKAKADGRNRICGAEPAPAEAAELPLIF